MSSTKDVLQRISNEWNDEWNDLTILECKGNILEECEGVCRFRGRSNGGILKPDLFQYYARGVLKGGE